MAQAAQRHFDWLDKAAEALQGGHIEFTGPSTKSFGDALRMALAQNRQENASWYGVKLVQTVLPRKDWELGQQGGVKKFSYSLQRHQGNGMLKSAGLRELEAGGDKIARRIPEPERQIEEMVRLSQQRLAREHRWKEEGNFTFMPSPVEHVDAAKGKTAEEIWCETMHEVFIPRFGEEEVHRACMFLQARNLTAPFEKARDWEPTPRRLTTDEAVARFMQTAAAKTPPESSQ